MSHCPTVRRAVPVFGKQQDAEHDQQRPQVGARTIAIGTCCPFFEDSTAFRPAQQFPCEVPRLHARPAAQWRERAGTHEGAREAVKKGLELRGHSAAAVVQERGTGWATVPDVGGDWMLKERGERMHRGFEWSTPWRGVG